MHMLRAHPGLVAEGARRRKPLRQRIQHRLRQIHCQDVSHAKLLAHCRTQLCCLRELRHVSTPCVGRCTGVIIWELCSRLYTGTMSKATCEGTTSLMNACTAPTCRDFAGRCTWIEGIRVPVPQLTMITLDAGPRLGTSSTILSSHCEVTAHSWDKADSICFVDVCTWMRCRLRHAPTKRCERLRSACQLSMGIQRLQGLLHCRRVAEGLGERLIVLLAAQRGCCLLLRHRRHLLVCRCRRCRRCTLALVGPEALAWMKRLP